MPPFTWKGREGQYYVVTEVANDHLRYTHRLFAERYEKAVEILAAKHWLSEDQKEEKLNVLIDAVTACMEEIIKRGLVPLPVRSFEEQQAAIARAQRWNQQQAPHTQQVNVSLVDTPVAPRIWPPQPQVVPQPITTTNRGLAELRRLRQEKQQRYEQKEQYESASPVQPRTERRILLLKKPTNNTE